MRLNTAFVISGIVFLIGFFFEKSYLWLPLSFLVASTVDLFVRDWVMSDKLGSAATLSMLLKAILASVMFYAMVGQLISVGLLVWWFI